MQQNCLYYFLIKPEHRFQFQFLMAKNCTKMTILVGYFSTMFANFSQNEQIGEIQGIGNFKNQNLNLIINLVNAPSKIELFDFIGCIFRDISQNLRILPWVCYKDTSSLIFIIIETAEIWLVRSMEKQILNLIKKQATSMCNLMHSSQNIPAKLISSISKNLIAERLQNQYMVDSSLRLASFVDYKAFRNHLHQKNKQCPPSQISYFLNSNILPSMLPSNIKLSIFHQYLFQEGLKLTNPKNITFNCPFKTDEALTKAAKLGIKNMVVNTAEEIFKIQQINRKFNYIWQFDQINPQEAQTIFELLMVQNISLKGLRFKEIDVGSLQQIQKIIQIGRMFNHDLRKNTFQLRTADLQNFKTHLKNCQSKLVGQVTDVSSSKFIVCAAKVIGKNKYVKVFSDPVYEILAEGQSEVSIETSCGEWVLFHPKKCMDLQKMSLMITDVSLEDAE